MRAVTLAGLLLVLGALAIYAGWRTAAPPPPARAAVAPTGDLVYRQGSYSLQLTEKPCDFDELRDALETDGAMGEMHLAIVTEGNRRFSACWARSVDEVLVQDLNGRGGMLPLEWFKKDG